MKAKNERLTIKNMKTQINEEVKILINKGL